MQLPTRWHRFNSIQDDVGKAPVEVFSIGQERRESPSPISLEANALLLQTLTVGLDDTLQETGEGNRGTVQARWPRQLEQFFDDKIDAIQFLRHNPVELLHKTTIVMLAPDELGEGSDRSEGILDLVRHAGSHLSQSCQTVSPVQTALQRLHRR